MKASAKRMLLMRSNQNNGQNAENRFRDDRGREHYDNGRYAPVRSEYPQDIWAGSRRDYNEHNERRHREEREPMGIIGFNMDSRPSENRPSYPDDAGYYNMNEMEHQGRQQMRRGYAESNGQRLSRDEAMAWARDMENEDGTRGPHWTMEQAKQVMAQKGVDCDPLEFWLTLNMMYSDYCKVFRKHGVGDKIDFYVDMAKAFLDDKDSVRNKLTRYYDSVVRH